MTRIKRAAGAAGAAVLLTFSLTACGGAPDDASKDDFCEVALNETGDDADAVNDWGDELEEVGTPEDIPDDARDGFELLVETAKDVDDDDLDNEELFEEFSDDEQDQFTAYSQYVSETCDQELQPDDGATE